MEFREASEKDVDSVRARLIRLQIGMKSGDIPWNDPFFDAVETIISKDEHILRIMTAIREALS